MVFQNQQPDLLHCLQPQAVHVALPQKEQGVSHHSGQLR